MSRRRPKLGDVVQVELPDGTFAYGRVLEDAGVAFYKARSTEPGMPPIGRRDYDFVAAVADHVVRGWPVVGHDPSQNPADDWPPPSYIDDGRGRFRIYHKGVLRAASAEEVRGLDPQAIYDIRHVIDRLVTGRRPLTPAEFFRERGRRMNEERAGEARNSIGERQDG